MPFTVISFLPLLVIRMLFTGPEYSIIHATVADSSNTVPITLFVSSQEGYEVNPVNISVIFDTKDTVVNQSFYDQGGHNFSRFELRLRVGVHQIVAQSINGNAGLDVVLPVEKPTWLTLFYFGKNHFQLNVSYIPVGFR